MATQQGIESRTEAAILARLVHPERDDLSEEAATALLRLDLDRRDLDRRDLDRRDLDRLHELVTKNQDNALTVAERNELESYLRVSVFLDLIHAKARHSLKRKS